MKARPSAHRMLNSGAAKQPAMAISACGVGSEPAPAPAPAPAPVNCLVLVNHIRHRADSLWVCECVSVYVFKFPSEELHAFQKRKVPAIPGEICNLI